MLAAHPLPLSTQVCSTPVALPLSTQALLANGVLREDLSGPAMLAAQNVVLDALFRLGRPATARHWL